MKIKEHEDNEQKDSTFKDRIESVLDSVMCKILYFIFYPILKLFRRD